MNTFGISVVTIPVDGTLIDKYLTNIYILRFYMILQKRCWTISGFQIFSGERDIIMGLRTCFRANRFREDWWTNRGPFWFTRINKRFTRGRWRGGLLGTKGRRRRRRINGETGGRCPGTGGSRVVYLDTDAKTNGTIKLNSSQTPARRALSPPLSRSHRFTCSRSSTYVYTRFATVSIQISIHDLYILIVMII